MTLARSAPLAYGNGVPSAHCPVARAIASDVGEGGLGIWGSYSSNEKEDL